MSPTKSGNPKLMGRGVFGNTFNRLFVSRGHDEKSPFSPESWTLNVFFIRYRYFGMTRECSSGKKIGNFSEFGGGKELRGLTAWLANDFRHARWLRVT